VRGLAVLLMIGDHVARLLPYGEVYRLSLGRLAMPLFFLVAGSLVTRVRWRHLWVALLGLLLPLVVPWLDWPNVLTWWAVGCVVIVVLRGGGVPVWLLAAVALVRMGNGWGVQVGNSYDPAALVGLMALGSMVGPVAFAWGNKLPAWSGFIGRHPLGWYVGHAVALQLVIGVL
jgi:surface polysaccharide O-acyltransferase-like enzyme